MNSIVGSNNESIELQQIQTNALKKSEAVKEIALLNNSVLQLPPQAVVAKPIIKSTEDNQEEQAKKTILKETVKIEKILNKFFYRELILPNFRERNKTLWQKLLTFLLIVRIYF